jgi:hypothetical protein
VLVKLNLFFVAEQPAVLGFVQGFVLLLKNGLYDTNFDILPIIADLIAIPH